MKKIVLASNSQGKIREFNDIFAPIGVEVIPQSQFNIPEIDEPYFTFLENALHKARHCSKYTTLTVLADDSGVCANALNGRPGVFSARFAGEPRSSLNNSLKLVKELAPHQDKSAYYYCMLILIRQTNDPQPIIADGILNGIIADNPRGNNGFGYDAHMFLPQYNKTVAELNSDDKNSISHRALAIKELIKKIKVGIF